MRFGAALVAGSLVVGACGGSSSPRAGAHPPACVKPPAGIGPNAAGTLQLQDQGKSVCLRVGQELTVFLRAPNPDGPLWGSIRASDTAVLEPGNTGIMTLVRGVTGGVFNARRAGVVRLVSTRNACDDATTTSVPNGGCEKLSWSATVVVP